MKKWMKYFLKLFATIVVVSVIVVALNLLIEGVPLFGAPALDEIEKVVVEHQEYPGESKEFTDDENIELAKALLGYLRYSPLKGLTDDNWLIQIT